MGSKGVDKIEKKCDRNKFQEGEHVLCFHGPLIYEAKCIKIKDDAEEVHYLIHYNGWNKSWDEWVAESRLLKINEENLKKKAELDRNQKPAKKSCKRRTSVGSGGTGDDNNSRSNSPKPPLFNRKSISSAPATQITLLKTEKLGTDIPRKIKSTAVSPVIHKNANQVVKLRKPKSTTKRKCLANSEISPREQPGYLGDCELFCQFLISELRTLDEPFRDLELEYHDNITIRIQIPEEIQNILVYDLELVSKRKKVPKLPARVTIDDITEDYVLFKTRNSEQSSNFKETALAVKDYFDAVLPTKLLYPIERIQHQKYFESKNILPSSVYGVVHLLRMIVKIGPLLAHIPLDDFGTNLIEGNINDYLSFVNVNIQKFICIDDYHSAPMVRK